MDILGSIFKYRKVNEAKLLEFGFKQEAEKYVYQRILSESGFLLKIQVVNGQVTADVIDLSINEPYTLYLVENAAGSFVGSVRSQYKETLTEIAEKCCDIAVFKSEQTKELIAYVQKEYGDELEFLWKKFPGNAVWRRKDNKKWYAAILSVSRRKLGLETDELVEIIDLRLGEGNIEALVDNKLYFPGWHMNKKSWYTIILDGSVPIEEIYGRIGISYRKAGEK